MADTAFEWLSSINEKTFYAPDRLPIGDYNAFFINRGLSQHADTVLMANEMNIYHRLPEKMQFDYHYHMVRKKKRYRKWAKTVDVDNVSIVQKAFNVNKQRAMEYLDLLSNVDIKEMKEMLRVD